MIFTESRTKSVIRNQNFLDSFKRSLRRCRPGVAVEFLREWAGFVLALKVFVFLISWDAAAATRSFRLPNTSASVTLEDVSDRVQVYLVGMRPNLVRGAWNLDVVVSNRSDQILRGPMVWVLEEATGSSGALDADARDGTDKAFYEVAPANGASGLAPATTSTKRTVLLGRTLQKPVFAYKVFANPPDTLSVPPGSLGITQTLDDLGQPLPEVGLFPVAGDVATRISDPEAGVADLGVAESRLAARFERPGYNTAWRSIPAGLDAVTPVPTPRLTPQAPAVEIAVFEGGVVSNRTGTIRATFPSGSFGEPTAVRLTPLDGQSLPSLLPLGWSPLQAFWLESSRDANLETRLELTPWGPLEAGENVVLGRWNPTTTTWEVVRVSQGTISTPLVFSGFFRGAYALLVPDRGIVAPPIPVESQVLAGSSSVAVTASDWSVSGSVTPSVSAASVNPDEVTAMAELVVSTLSAVPLPSGTLLRGDVTESYALMSGEIRRLPQYESSLVAYQRPGDDRADTLHASFRLRPRLLLKAEELVEGRIRVEVQAPSAFVGAVLGPDGGTLASGNIQLLAPAAAVSRPIPGRLRLLEPLDFQGLFPSVVGTSMAAFELELPAINHPLLLRVVNLPVSSSFVLGRTLHRSGRFGFEPVERFRTTETGILQSAEPLSGDRLPGIRHSGQYVLVRVEALPAFIGGTVQGVADGDRALVRVGDQPWLSPTDAEGRYRLLAPRGVAAEIHAEIPARQAEAIAQVAVPGTGSPSPTLLTLEEQPPRVISVEPASGAKSVPRITSVTIHFNHPIQPATVLGGGIGLTDRDGNPVEFTVALNLRNTSVTLLPVEPLEPSTAHAVVVKTTVKDLLGRPLPAEATSEFTTESAEIDRSGAGLVIYEPLNGDAGMSGSPGTAEPGSPVILVNEISGRTATELSKPDGSFSNSIPADIDDRLSAVLLNRNGTRTTIPASRQLFRDGSVALFAGGGTLDVATEAGPAQFIVEPGAIDGKSKFKIEAIPSTELATAVDNVAPPDGKVLNGFKVSPVLGSPVTQSLDVRVPVARPDLGLPEGVDPAAASFGLALVRKVQGDTVFELIDRMHYEAGHLVTHSPPFDGFLPSDPAASGLPLALLNLGSQGIERVVHGRVVTVQLDQAGARIPNSLRPLSGAIVEAISPFSGGHGRLFPGAVFAVSRANGTYALLTRAPVIRATHSSFPGVLVMADIPVPVSGVGVVESTNFFEIPYRPYNFDPDIRVTTRPARPLPGQTVEVDVKVTQLDSAPVVTVETNAAVTVPGSTPVALDSIQWALVGESTHPRNGAFVVEKKYALLAGEKLDITLRIRAANGVGAFKDLEAHVVLGALALGGPVASDPHDTTGPRLVGSYPSPGSSSLTPGESIRLHFDEALADIVGDGSALVSLSPTGTVSSVTLARDRMSLLVRCHDLIPGTTYTLTLNGPQILDLNNNSYDSGGPAGATTTIPFSTAPWVGGFMDVGTDSDGAGAVIVGQYAIVARRLHPLPGTTADISELAVYRPEPTGTGVVASLKIGGSVRDIVRIPKYAFRYFPTSLYEDPAQRKGARVEHLTEVMTRDLVAVVGGRAGESSFLRIVDVTDPLHLNLLAGSTFGKGASQPSRVQWSAPELAILETGTPDLIRRFNLQSYLIGNVLAENSTYFQTNVLTGIPGLDTNADGDYVDAGENPPIPGLPDRDIPGRIEPFAVPDSNQPIRDFSLESGGAFLGALVLSGTLTDGGIPVPQGYRTLLASGQLGVLGSDPATWSMSGFLPIPTSPQSPSSPRRLKTLLRQPLNDGAIHNLVLVSINKGSVPGSAFNLLGVIDVTDPLEPVWLIQIPLPKEPDAQSLYSMEQRADGKLLLASDRVTYLIDPKLFSEPNPADGVHPAIVARIPGIGGDAWTFGTTDSGTIVSARMPTLPSFLSTPPHLEIVQFPGENPFQPLDLIARGSETAVVELLKRRIVPGQVRLARYREEPDYCASTLAKNGPDNGLWQVHNYVLVRAAGIPASTLELKLTIESLNWAGAPLKNRGFLFPPVRTGSPSLLAGIDEVPAPDDGPVRPSIARRLSMDPASPLFDYFLSGPFVVVAESMSVAELEALDVQFRRDVLWSGHFVRASIDPEQGHDPIWAPFAGTVVGGEYRPGVAVVARSLPGEYLQSPNPAPIQGGASVPLTRGLVGAHNREFTVRMVDMSLPGRRMPLVFERDYHGQGLYDGPFGRGWDFNFNQRLVELDPELIAPGYIHATVPREMRDEAEFAGPRDILFYGGGGRVLVFKYAGDTPPPEIAADPLARALDWVPGGPNPPSKAVAYYLPPRGLFTPLFKMGDGRFVMLSPEGTQTWFNPQGRLAKIYDRFEKNAIRLDYNETGDLIRILDDRSGSGNADFALEIGYWRNGVDPSRAGLDLLAARPFLAGRIAVLRDYTDRTVLFEYHHDGTLKSKASPDVQSLADGTSTSGRLTHLFYYSGTGDPLRSSHSLRAIHGPSPMAGLPGGVPTVSVEAWGNARDTVARLRIEGQNVEIQQTSAVDAREFFRNPAALEVKGPGSGAAQMKFNLSFDPLGRPRVTTSGEGTGTLTYRTEYRDDGLVRTLVQPEGNSVSYVYDPDHPVLRSRANVRRVEETPDPRRGGLPRVQHATWDDRYNLPSGVQLDAKNQEAVVTLQPDGRFVATVSKGGETETNVFNAYGQLERHVSPQQIHTAVQYNSHGFPEATTTGNLTTQFSYEGPAGLRGLPASVTDPTGTATSMRYDELDRVIEQNRPGQGGTASVKVCFDGAGNVCKQAALVEPGREVVERFEHDDFGFLKTHIVENVEVGSVQKEIVYRFEPDEYRRVRAVIPPSGERLEHTFDGFGRLSRSRMGSSWSQSQSYDGNGNLLRSAMGSAVTTFAYDGLDRPTNSVTPTGAMVVQSWDANDNVIQVQTFDTNDNNRLLSQVTSVPDPLDRPIEVRQRVSLTGVGPGSELITRLDYLSASRQVKVTDPAQQTTTATLDANGQLLGVADSVSSMQQVYDFPGRTVTRTITDGQGPRVNVSTFDPLGNLTRHQDARGKVTQFTSGFDGRILSATTPEGRTYLNEYTVLGEPRRASRPDGQTLEATYDVRRQLTSVAPVPVPGKGLSYEYDDLGRLTSQSFADDKGNTNSAFNDLQQPELTHLARGFVATNTYDAAGRLVRREIAGLGPVPRVDAWKYDALSRVVVMTNNVGTVTHEYDLRGLVSRIDYGQLGGVRTLRQQFNATGARTNLTYSDGTSVGYERDPQDRLRRIVPDGHDPVIDSSTYGAGNLVTERILGPGIIRATYIYDENRRPLVRRFMRIADSNILAEVRYAYDGSGMQIARQYVHEGNRTDLFHYDGSHKLIRADMRARPKVPGEVPRTLQGFDPPAELPNRENWAPGFYAREFAYTPTEVMTNATLINPDGLTVPPFASEFAEPDVTLHVPRIDGVDRHRDEAGNVTTGQVWIKVPGNPTPQPVLATFHYDEFNLLTRVERADGVVVESIFGPTGLRIRQRVTGPADRCWPMDEEYVYDGIVLVETRDRRNKPAQPRSRLYYGDTDELIAADVTDASGLLHRYSYLTDASGTVMALADESGKVVERSEYDIWGSVRLLGPDTIPPMISKVKWDGFVLQIEFTDQILPVTAAIEEDTGLFTAYGSLDDSIEVFANGARMRGVVRFRDLAGGHRPRSMLRFETDGTDGVPTSLVMRSSVFRDRAGNPNVAENLTLIPENGGYEGPPTEDPLEMARSSIGSALGFQGQFLDENTGTLYLRARSLLTTGGGFLQRDPFGYVDSANPYSELGSNPVNRRDPTGTQTEELDTRRIDNYISTLSANREAQVRGASDGAIAPYIGELYWKVFEAILNGDRKRAQKLLKRHYTDEQYQGLRSDMIQLQKRLERVRFRPEAVSCVTALKWSLSDYLILSGSRLDLDARGMRGFESRHGGVSYEDSLEIGILRELQDSDSRGTVFLSSVRRELGFTTLFVETSQIESKADRAARKNLLAPANAKLVLGLQSRRQIDVRVPIDEVVRLGIGSMGEREWNWQRVKDIDFAFGTVKMGKHTFVLSKGWVWELHYAEAPGTKRYQNLIDIGSLDDFVRKWGSESLILAVPPEH